MASAAAKRFWKTYIRWEIATITFSLAYASEKWANQSWPIWPTEWIGVIVFNLTVPFFATILTKPLQKYFVNPFEPRKVDDTTLNRIIGFVGVDNLRDGQEISLITQEQEAIIEKFKKRIREESSLKSLRAGAGTEEYVERQKLEKLHFPAAYGSLCLLRERRGEPPCQSVRFICTQDAMSSPKNGVGVEEYAKNVLTLLDVINERTVVKHDFQAEEEAKNIEKLVVMFNNAVELSQIDLRSHGDRESRVAIDSTGGNVLHSIAAVKAANTYEAVLLYNQSSKAGREVVSVEV
jgi:hypothetical protein